METLTIREAALRCGISYSALRKRVDRGTIESIKEDGVRRVTRATLERAGLWPEAAPVEAEPAAAAAAAVRPEREAIARRAYELHLAEGGDELDNWLKAERELVGSP